MARGDQEGEEALSRCGPTRKCSSSRLTDRRQRHLHVGGQSRDQPRHRRIAGHKPEQRRLGPDHAEVGRQSPRSAAALARSRTTLPGHGSPGRLATAPTPSTTPDPPRWPGRSPAATALRPRTPMTRAPSPNQPSKPVTMHHLGSAFLLDVADSRQAQLFQAGKALPWLTRRTEPGKRNPEANGPSSWAVVSRQGSHSRSQSRSRRVRTPLPPSPRRSPLDVLLRC
jgi:hypothetical protein